jgi:ankyrin repeat protein
MGNEDVWLIRLIFVVLLGLIPAAIARSRGRSFGLWWVYGTLFFIIAIIHALLLHRDDMISAVLRGDLLAVQGFISKGADVNANNNDGGRITALIVATEEGHKEVVRLLLANGADINVKDKNGETALMLASYYGRKEIVKLLLAKRADVNAKSNNGATALMNATKKGHKEIKELLIRAGAK